MDSMRSVRSTTSFRLPVLMRRTSMPSSLSCHDRLTSTIIDTIDGQTEALCRHTRALYLKWPRRSTWRKNRRSAGLRRVTSSRLVLWHTLRHHRNRFRGLPSSSHLAVRPSLSHPAHGLPSNTNEISPWQQQDHSTDHALGTAP